MVVGEKTVETLVPDVETTLVAVAFCVVVVEVVDVPTILVV